MRLQQYPFQIVQIQPRGGRTTSQLQASLLRKLDEAGADVLPITVDSNTRLEKYEEAQQLYAQALTEGVDSLNGFPFMAIPADEIVDMISGFAHPFSLRHGSPIAHRLVEKALSCGIDEIEGGPLTYSLPYTRSTTLEEAISSWKTVEEMCASSKTRLNQAVLRESFGVLTAVLVPPYVAILVSLLEAIFSYSNGVRHFMIGLQSCGNLSQDIVQFEAARRAVSYLAPSHFPDLNMYYAYHHWMGPFPKNSTEADSIIDICNLSAHVVQADKVVVKTNVEAYGVPSEEANAKAVRRTKKLLSQLTSMQSSFQVDDLELEIQFLVSELLLGIERITRADSCEDALIQAVHMGQVDLMFSPHQSVQRQLEVQRDERGWIRILDDGQLTLSKEYLKFEKRNSTIGDLVLPSSKIVADMLWPREANIHLVKQVKELVSQSAVEFDDEQ